MQTNVKQWVRAAAVRAAKTAAQASLGVIGASAAMGEVQWALVGSAAVLAAIVSMLTSVTGIPEVDEGASIAKIAKQCGRPAQSPHASQQPSWRPPCFLRAHAASVPRWCRACATWRRWRLTRETMTC